MVPRNPSLKELQEAAQKAAAIRPGITVLAQDEDGAVLMVLDGEAEGPISAQ